MDFRKDGTIILTREEALNWRKHESSTRHQSQKRRKISQKLQFKKLKKEQLLKKIEEPTIFKYDIRKILKKIRL